MKKNSLIVLIKCLCLVSVIFLASGCANQQLNQTGSNYEDPLEPLNRKIAAFNAVADKIVLEPIVKIYTSIIPAGLYFALHNVFSNLNEVPTIINDVLQARMLFAISDTMRLAINSTLGMAGLFDVASGLNLPHHTQDLGITLRTWGFKSSPYLMLPLLGPSTMFDSAASYVTFMYAHPWSYLSNGREKTIGDEIDILHQRAEVDPAVKIAYQSHDPYLFMRNGYLQKRNAMLNEPSYYEQKDKLIQNNKLRLMIRQQETANKLQSKQKNKSDS